ncbi:MAG TPA: ABC transporter permease [Gemmatimonadales bacterium]
MSDLRYARRQLVRHPGFGLVVILTLALGIGANTAIFSVIDGVLLRPAPFDEMDRLVMVWETDRNTGTTREPASVPDYLDFRDRATTLAALAAFSGTETVLTPDGGEPVRLASLAVSHEYLPMVGIAPIIGRAFAREDDVPGAQPVALIGEELWERRFERDPSIVGRTIILNDVPATVIGVLRSDADFGTLQVLDAAAYARAFADRGEAVRVDVWIPLAPDSVTSPRSTHPIFVLGKMAPGLEVPAVQDEMTRITTDLEQQYSENDARGAHVESLSNVVFGPIRPALYVLLAAVALVLLVACANVANLLLARGTARVRDLAVRTALGADLARLARQYLVEGMVLAVLGAAVGIAFAVWGTHALLVLAPADVPRLTDVGVDLRVLGVTLVVSLVVGIGFGLVPTVQATRLDLQSALKGESRGAVSPGRFRGRVRGALVISQLALAVVLVVGAGLLLRSFWRLQSQDAGFHTEGVLKAEFVLPRTRYPVDFRQWPNFAEIHRFNDNVLRRLEGVPGVRSAALAGNHPLDAGFTNSFVVVGREAEARDWPEISVRRVSPGYFETVSLAVHDGRPLQARDGTFDPTTAVINEAAAARFFPDGVAIGQQIAFWGSARTIVGIVANEKFQGLAQPAPLAIYVPMAQAPAANGAETLLVRTAGDPAALIAAVPRAIRDLDDGLAVYGVEPLTATVGRGLGRERFTMFLLGTFAALAVVLAALGVHAVLSYLVARRVPEMGIRMALGATQRSVVGLVLLQGVQLAAIGLALGLAGALLATRILRSLLYGISPNDPITYGVVALGVFVLAMVASVIPAWRATRIDPLGSLRAE